MRMNANNLGFAVDAWRRIGGLVHPADAALKQFFKDNPKMGKSDRHFVSETSFGILRKKRFIEYLIEQSDEKVTPRRMVLAYFIRVFGLNLREIQPYLSESEIKWVGRIKAVPLGSIPPTIESEFPDWIFDKLSAVMSFGDILDLSRSMQSPAPFDLRVNTAKASREDVMQELQKQGILAEATPYSPVGIRLKEKCSLNENPLFAQGKVEVQDEGSQILSYLVSPKRREMIVDFCAGAGGKTLHIGAIMQSQGRIYAFDTSERRLNNLKPRLKRSGLSNVTPQLIQNENDLKIKRLSGKIDRVLVDAPCSGLGTLRRSPDIKFRQTPETLDTLAQKQASILQSASILLKKEGRLVYATCSFLPEENQAIVENFLKKNGQFKLLDCAEILKGQGIALDTGKYLQLFPSGHGTDGFFAAVMEKSGGLPDGA